MISTIALIYQSWILLLDFFEVEPEHDKWFFSLWMNFFSVCQSIDCLIWNYSERHCKKKSSHLWRWNPSNAYWLTACLFRRKIKSLMSSSEPTEAFASWHYCKYISVKWLFFPFTMCCFLCAQSSNVAIKRTAAHLWCFPTSRREEETGSFNFTVWVTLALPRFIWRSEVSSIKGDH